MYTHTKVTFEIKDEPILDSIQKEFKGINYTISATTSSKYTLIELNIAKVIKSLPGDFILMDGYKTQFEFLKHY